MAGGAAGEAIGSSYGGPIGGMIGKYVGEKIGSWLGDKAEDELKEQMNNENGGDEGGGDKKDEEEEKKKKGGACGGKSNSGDQAAEYPPGTDPDTDLGEVGMDDVDDTTNSMCKKIFTVFRDIPKDFSCPVAQRDNVADQFTPLDDLMTMEKTTKDFLNLEGKIYDPETTNPRFFASEDWVQTYTKDKNVVLALLDQYRANTTRMEHLNTIVDNNSYEKLLTIPNQDCKSSFQTNINWTARALKDYANNWFKAKYQFGSKYPGTSTKLWEKDYWMPGLTGMMISWMKTGHYCEFNMRPINNETIIRKVDKLEAVIDRLMNSDAVA